MRLYASILLHHEKNIRHTHNINISHHTQSQFQHSLHLHLQLQYYNFKHMSTARLHNHERYTSP